jgi:hypothetical protein
VQTASLNVASCRYQLSAPTMAGHVSTLGDWPPWLSTLNETNANVVPSSVSSVLI